MAILRNPDGLFLYSVLIAVPNDIVETARLDGAGPWAIFWKIKFPLVLPQFGLIVILTFIYSTLGVAFDLGPSPQWLGARPELLDRHSRHLVLPHLLRLERAAGRSRSWRHRRHRHFHADARRDGGLFLDRPAPAQGACRMTDPGPGRILVGDRRWTLERVGVHIVLIIFVALALAPILVVIVNSMKTTPAIFGGPFKLPTSETFSLDGYGRVFTRGNFLLNYRNSIIVTVAAVGLTVVFSTLAAFALVEYRLKITPLLASLFVVGVMLPIGSAPSRSSRS